MKHVLEYVLDYVKSILSVNGQDLFCIKLACAPRGRLCLNTQLVNRCAVSDYRVIGIARLYAEFGEDPDPVGKFERLIQHVLAFYVPLGDGVDVVVLQFAWHRICQYHRRMVTQQDNHTSLSLEYSYQQKSYVFSLKNINIKWSNERWLEVFPM